MARKNKYSPIRAANVQRRILDEVEKATIPGTQKDFRKMKALEQGITLAEYEEILDRVHLATASKDIEDYFLSLDL